MLILHDICPGSKPLHGCHCAPIVWGFWHEKLPQAVRLQLAEKSFTASTYTQLFDHADKIWQENGGVVSNAEPVTVAAVESGAAQSVSAVSNRGGRGRGRGRGQNRGRGRGGAARGAAAQNSNNNTNAVQNATQTSTTGFVNTGPRSQDLPPSSCCSEHWRRGNSATFCFSPLDCPWKDRIVPRQNANKNSKN